MKCDLVMTSHWTRRVPGSITVLHAFFRSWHTSTYHNVPLWVIAWCHYQSSPLRSRLIGQQSSSIHSLVVLLTHKRCWLHVSFTFQLRPSPTASNQRPPSECTMLPHHRCRSPRILHLLNFRTRMDDGNVPFKIISTLDNESRQKCLLS